MVVAIFAVFFGILLIGVPIGVAIASALCDHLKAEGVSSVNINRDIDK